MPGVADKLSNTVPEVVCDDKKDAELLDDTDRLFE